MAGSERAEEPLRFAVDVVGGEVDPATHLERISSVLEAAGIVATVSRIGHPDAGRTIQRSLEEPHGFEEVTSPDDWVLREHLDEVLRDPTRMDGGRTTPTPNAVTIGWN